MWQSMIFEVLHASLMPLHISTRAVLLEEVLAEISIPSHPRIAFEHLSLYIQKDLGNNGQQSAVLLASLMPFLHHRKRQLLGRHPIRWVRQSSFTVELRLSFTTEPGRGRSAPDRWVYIG